MEINGELVSSGRKKLGAIIGDNTKTGVNVSIYPGRKLGPNAAVDPGAIVYKNVGKDQRFTFENKIVS